MRYSESLTPVPSFDASSKQEISNHIIVSCVSLAFLSHFAFVKSSESWNLEVCKVVMNRAALHQRISHITSHFDVYRNYLLFAYE